MKPKRNVHDSLVDLIGSRLLEDKFTYITREEEYGEGTLGETDVLGVKYNNICIFECKSNDNHRLLRHGIDQLERAKGYYRRTCPGYRVFTFLVYYNKDGNPACKWIK